MNAALLVENNKPLEIRKAFCDRLDYGQVHVKVIQSGICGAQLQEISGHKSTGPKPHLLGHEGVGVVLNVGAGVSRVKIGDKVVMHWRKAAGIESAFPKYKLEGNSPKYTTPAYFDTITSGRVCTLTEEAICSENRLTSVPDSTDNDFCALLGCGLSTALGVVENDADLQFGERVLIVGAGGLGVNLILASKLRQASQIAVVDFADGKDSIVSSLGATFSKSIPATKFDVIIDTTGHPAVFKEAICQLDSGGRFVMVGQPNPGVSLEIVSARSMFDGEGKTIKATQGGGFSPDRDIPRYVRLLDSGLLKTGGVVTHRFTLQNVNSGLEAMRSGIAGRVMVDL